ncbi:MAG: hypothetical protein AAF415_12450 [Pseudomonadota bacterium]
MRLAALAMLFAALPDIGVGQGQRPEWEDSLETRLEQAVICTENVAAGKRTLSACFNRFVVVCSEEVPSRARSAPCHDRQFELVKEAFPQYRDNLETCKMESLQYVALGLVFILRELSKGFRHPPV